MESTRKLDDVPTREVMILRGHQGLVMAVTFNADGQYCMSGGQDKLIKLWNPLRGNTIKTYEGHGYEVRDIVITNDNAKFASCGGDKLVFFWDISTGRIVRKFQGHFNRVNCVDINTEGTILFSGSYDATVRIWDLRASTFKPIQILDEAKDSVTSICVSSEEVLTSSVDGCARTYDLRKGCIQEDYIGHPVTSTTFSHDKNCILTASMDSSLRLFDKMNGELLNEYKGHKNTEFKIDCCLSNNDAHVISGSEDGKIFFWDLVEAKIVHTSKASQGIVCALCYHPTDNMLLSGMQDGLAKLWVP